MPWKQQGGGGGPWGSGGGPWGSGGGGGPQPPDFEEILRKGQDRVRKILPGGKGSPAIIVAIIILGLFIWALTGFYRVEPNEVGVPLLFGKMQGKAPPGLNWNWPAPLGSVELPEVTNINVVEIGYRSDGRGARRAQIRNVPQESLMLTGDENIIDIQFAVFWKIDTRVRPESQPVVTEGTPVERVQSDGIRNYLFNIRNPDETVKAAAEAAMREIIGKSDFEYVRTEGRVEIERAVRELIQLILDDYGAGVDVTQVQMQKVDPPARVLDAFRDVQAARADKERKMNEATGYAYERTERAKGEAQQILRTAEAYKQSVIARAQGEADRFLNLYAEYKNQEFVTRRRIYLEAMRDIMAGMDKVLIDDRAGGVVPYLPLNELLKRKDTTKPEPDTGAGAPATGASAGAGQ